jgi:hypothetical protein
MEYISREEVQLHEISCALRQNIASIESGSRGYQRSGVPSGGKPEYFYVVNGDAMLKLDTKWAYSPGVGGFSMHAPKSLNFIVCLNLDGGVPFLSSSPIQKGKVTWNGHDFNRFK